MLCEKIESIVSGHLNEMYDRFMFIRVYQIKLSYYIALKIGMIKDSKTAISDATAKMWYDKVCAMELPGEFRGLEIIRNAGQLLFYFDGMTQEESLNTLKKMAINRGNLTKNGFFRVVSDELMLFLGRKITDKFPDTKEIVAAL